MGNADGGHQEIDRADFLDHRFDASWIGDVSLMDRAAHAERFDLVLGLLGGIGFRDVVQRDVGALLRERQAHRPADATRSSGHQGDTPLEFSISSGHGAPPLVVFFSHRRVGQRIRPEPKPI